MGRIHSHHCESLAGTGLTIGKNGTVVALKTVDSAFLTHFLKHVFLGVVIGDRVEGELFIFISVKGLYRVGMILHIDTNTIVLLLLPNLDQKSTFQTRV